jgi:hypothetical protein
MACNKPESDISTKPALAQSVSSINSAAETGAAGSLPFGVGQYQLSFRLRFFRNLVVDRV